MSYFVHSDENRKEMLKTIGIGSIEELFDCIPENICNPEIELDKPLDEKSLKEELCVIGGKNKMIKNFFSFIGGGAYNHYIPGAVKSILGISQFYTSYTPYQAEISQGTLQYMFEFQSLICRITGMDISNASMYDGASSLAEAILMAGKINGNKKVLLSAAVNPQYREVCRTYCSGQNIDIKEVGYKNGKTDINLIRDEMDEMAGSVIIIIQNPNFFGCFEDVYELHDILKKYPECFFIAVINPMSIGLIKRPSDYGADIVVGEGQVFGNALSFGGPYLGFFATKKDYLRQIPGRIVGQTVDTDGNKTFVLTFQNREQHIRKYKATSNICTNHSLNALAATVYLSIIGENGLRHISNICLQRAHYFAEKIKPLDKFQLKFNSGFFNEFVLSSRLNIRDVIDRFYKNKILPGIYLGDNYPELRDCILVSITEMNSIESINKYTEVLKSF